MLISTEYTKHMAFRDLVKDLTDRAIYTRPAIGERRIVKFDVVGDVGSGKTALAQAIARSITEQTDRTVYIVGLDSNTLTEFTVSGVDGMVVVKEHVMHEKTVPLHMKEIREKLESDDTCLVLFHVDEFTASQEPVFVQYLNFYTGGAFGPHALTDEQCHRVIALQTGNSHGQGALRVTNTLANTTRGTTHTLVQDLTEVAEFIASKGLLPTPMMIWIQNSTLISKPNYHYQNADDTGAIIANAFTPRSFEDACIAITQIPGCLSDDGFQMTDKGYEILEGNLPKYIVDDIKKTAMQTQALTSWTDVVADPLGANLPESKITQHIQASVLYSGIRNQARDPRYIPAMVLYLTRKGIDFDVLATASYILKNRADAGLNAEDTGIDETVGAFCFQFQRAVDGLNQYGESESGKVERNNLKEIINTARGMYEDYTPDDLGDEVDDTTEQVTDEQVPQDAGINLDMELDLDVLSDPDLDMDLDMDDPEVETEQEVAEVAEVAEVEEDDTDELFGDFNL